MKRFLAIKKLKEWDSQGRNVFLKQDLVKLFPDDSPKTLAEGLHRLVKDGILTRACRNVYVNTNSQKSQSFIIEQIAKNLRRGYYNYVSLESILSEYGAISQIPIDHLTVMTTGRKGVHKTSFGTIEFTHTKRSVEDLINNTKTIKDRPLRIATLKTAWRDLKRVGRNTQLVNIQEINDE